MDIILDEENFGIFAANNYDNPACTDIQEFYSDLLRFKYIKKIVNKYIKDGTLQERLLLNHLTILGNVFGGIALKKMLIFKLDGKSLQIVKPFLIFLNLIRENEMTDIQPNPIIITKLREMQK